jgi:hypothetical protein
MTTPLRNPFREREGRALPLSRCRPRQRMNGETIQTPKTYLDRETFSIVRKKEKEHEKDQIVKKM